MNTTKLISQWSMGGAPYDVDGRLKATDAIGAVIAGGEPTSEPPAAASSLFIKGSDEDGWQPLENAKAGTSR